MSKALFDVIRRIKGGPLTQADVDAVNAVMAQPSAPTATRTVSPAGIALIHEFESLRLTTYRDPGPTGLPITGGWGATRDENGQPFKLGRTEVKTYWDALFERDINEFSRAVERLIGSAPTTQGQYDALVSFAYNVGAGEGGLKTSTLLRKHMAGDYAGAAAEFARWNKAKGVVLAGLTRRRAAEAKMYGGVA